MLLLALIALVGCLSFLVVVLTSVAYLALPSGRMCPRCGAPTSAILLESWWQRPASRWLQWRWCSRCSWEGVGRRGPDVGLQDSPVDHESGFRWRRTMSEQVPIFHWRDNAENPPDHPAGFRWSADDDGDDPPETDDVAEASQDGTPGHPSGFRWGGPRDNAPLFLWGVGAQTEPRETPSSPVRRPNEPWYLNWLPPRKSSGFRWKSKDH